MITKKLKLSGKDIGLKHKTFKANVEQGKPKYYILDMFPYPSGSGLHVGHVEGYTATDIIARYKTAKEVLMCSILWDGTALAFRQNNMPSEQEPIPQSQPKKISTPIGVNCNHWDLVMIGTENLRQVIQIIINGRSGFSLNFMKKVWLMKRKCWSIIARNWDCRRK